MRRLVVCDASAVIALMLDAGSDGRWAADTLTGAVLAAPSLLPFETANIVRRHEIAQIISADQAVQAHIDLLDLAIEYWPYSILAPRAWKLRKNMTTYDASYVALAEFLGAVLVTLDRGIRETPGLCCDIVTPS